MLPFRARVDLGAMSMKGYSAFPKAPALLEPHNQIVWCHIQDNHGAGYNPPAEVQSVYPTAPADRAIISLSQGSPGCCGNERVTLQYPKPLN